MQYFETTKDKYLNNVNPILRQWNVR